MQVLDNVRTMIEITQSQDASGKSSHYLGEGRKMLTWQIYNRVFISLFALEYLEESLKLNDLMRMNYFISCNIAYNLVDCDRFSISFT